MRDAEGICTGRVAVITGGGRGIGRAHALEFARQGAKVVVNDLGLSRDGRGSSASAATQVVEEITAHGGDAVANTEDIADWAGAGRLIHAVVEEYGRLDVLVNNAGFLRDRMFVATLEDEWDAILRVHVKGHAAPARWAAEYWRSESKAGKPVDARIINTTSGAGLAGSVGQAAYSAAKGAIVALTLVQAAELRRYGVTANAIAPAARTRMTADVFASQMAAPVDGAFDTMAPENIAPLVAWLGSPESVDVTGQVFEVEGGKVGVAQGWRYGPSQDRGERWEPNELGPVIRDLVEKAGEPAIPVYGSSIS